MTSTVMNERSRLQIEAKKLGIKANQKSDILRAEIARLQSKIPIDNARESTPVINVNIIRPEYIILTTLFNSTSIPTFEDLERALNATNKKIRIDAGNTRFMAPISLAFVAFHSDELADVETAINRHINPMNDHEHVKTALASLHRVLPDGISYLETKLDTIALHIDQNETVPYIQVLDTFSLALQLNEYAAITARNPPTVLTFHVSEEGENNEAFYIHNTILFSYYL